MEEKITLMNSDEAKFRASLPSIVRHFRRFGWVFFIATILFAIFITYSAFDPSVPFRVNGVETSDTAVRLRSAVFPWFLPLFVALFAFTPRAILERLLLHQRGEMMKIRRRLMKR